MEKTPVIMLCARNLSRAYGDFQALKPVDLSLESGDLVCLVGPNGAGKSTLLMCLSGLLRPTTGDVKVEGFDLYEDEHQVRKRLAYVPDVPVYYSELTAWEHLHFMALAHHVSGGFEEQAESILREFGLWEARDLYPHAYSRGMRLKLGLVLALIRPFTVLLLDEPISALDPESTDILAKVLLEKSASGAAVILSTHNLHFSKMLGAKNWLMRDGKLAIH